jgi:hypothetical protein
MLHPARYALAAQGPASLGTSPASSQPGHIIRMTASKLEISTCSCACRDTRFRRARRGNIKRRPDHVVQGRGHPSSAGSSCLGTHPDAAGRLGARQPRRGAEPHRPGPGGCGPGGGRRAASNHQACLTAAGMAVGAADHGGLAGPAWHRRGGGAGPGRRLRGQLGGGPLPVLGHVSRGPPGPDRPDGDHAAQRARRGQRVRDGGRPDVAAGAGQLGPGRDRPRPGGGSSPPARPSAGSPGGRPKPACSGSARLGADRWRTR